MVPSRDAKYETVIAHCPRKIVLGWIFFFLLFPIRNSLKVTYWVFTGVSNLLESVKGCKDQLQTGLVI